MPRTQSATLTEAELRIMQVLWEKGPATVQQVLEALPGEKPLAYNSVLTIIRMGRGLMMGVDHNRNMQWVGASAGLYPED